jgi:SPP1 gp7 family putative phage head morphogenesis protein
MRPKSKAEKRAKAVRAARALELPATAEAAYLRGFNEIVNKLDEDTEGDVVAQEERANRWLPLAVAALFSSLWFRIRFRQGRAGAVLLRGRSPTQMNAALDQVAIRASQRVQQYALKAMQDFFVNVKAEALPVHVGVPNSTGVLAAKMEQIATNEALRTNAEAIEAVQKAAGVESYLWVTMRDDRVRPTHAANEGRIFRWDTPSPITQHPGHDPNCRCLAVAIIPGV